MIEAGIMIGLVRGRGRGRGYFQQRKKTRLEYINTRSQRNSAEVQLCRKTVAQQCRIPSFFGTVEHNFFRHLRSIIYFFDLFCYTAQNNPVIN